MQRFCWVFLNFWVFRDPPYGAIQSYPAGNSVISSTLTQSKNSSRSHSCAAMCSPQKINFCMIFSVFLQLCWDSQLIFWIKNYIWKLYQKVQLLFLWPKFQKHAQHGKNRVFVMLWNWPFCGVWNFEIDFYSTFYAWNSCFFASYSS